MNPPLLKRLFNTLPWLHFTGACLVFVLIYLFTAIHSQLGHEISTGESPGFAWLGQHIFIFMGLAVGYLIAVGGLQRDWMRSNDNLTAAALKLPVRIQFIAVGLLALAVFNGWSHIISAVGFLLLGSILMQGYAVLWFQKFKNADDPHRLRQRASHTIMFLVLVFGLNVMIAQLDPSWHQLNQYIHPNSRAEMALRKIIPGAFAGTTGLWFGIVTLAIMALSVISTPWCTS